MFAPALVSPDGQSAASAGEDHTVLLWHLASARVVHTLRRHSGPVTHVAFSNSGRLISSAAGNEVCIWDTRNVASAGAARRPAVATAHAARAVSHDPTPTFAGGGPAPELAFEAPIPIATTAFYPQQPVLFACGEDVGGGDEGARDAVDAAGDEEIARVGSDFVEGFVEGGVGAGVFGVEETRGGVGADDEGGAGGGAGLVHEEWGFGE